MNGEQKIRPRTTNHRPLAHAALRPNPYSLPPRAHARRGVLLLVILSLLFMFVLIAITYVLVASRHLAVARQYARAVRTGGTGSAASAQTLLDSAVLQLIRGDAPVPDPAAPAIERYRSVIGPHNLLEDVYGITAHFRVTGTPTTPPAPQGAVLVLTAEADPNFPNFVPREEIGFYSGLVLTTTSGIAKGQSTRVVWSGPTVPPNQVEIHVLAFPNAALLADQDTFIVNGRPFGGTGFGFIKDKEPAGLRDTLSARDDGNVAADEVGGRKEFALLPNPVAYLQNDSSYGDYYQPTVYPNGVPFGGFGGANEDYDAPDYQNMHLAFIADATIYDSTSSTTTRTSQVILPSFHRPDLINYWFWRVRRLFLDNGNDPRWRDWTWAAGSNGADLLRRVMLRPNPIDHPNFSGSNPLLAANAPQLGTNLPGPGWQWSILGIDQYGNYVSPWDVDNDNDNVMDSVWIDLGSPIQSTASGKLYKPLYAILCVDLDGRVNVNAHGSTTELVAGYDPTPAQNGPYLGAAAGSATLPLGLGNGPADIRLSEFFTGRTRLQPPSPSPDQSEVLSILRGASIQINATTTVDVEGRYGEFGAAAIEAGRTNQRDSRSLIQWFQFPDPAGYGPPAAPLSSFTSAADLWGRRTVGLDYRGQPVYDSAVWTNETLNPPYNLDLFGPRQGQMNGTQSPDNAFTAADLERVLRQGDIDTLGLPARLWILFDSSNTPGSGMSDAPTAVRRAHQVTTDSWDVPTPGLIPPKHLRADLERLTRPTSGTGDGRATPINLVDLLGAKLLQVALQPDRDNVRQTNPTWTETEVEDALDDVGLYPNTLLIRDNVRDIVLPPTARQVLSDDALAGLRMSLNRPFGDGRDGNNNDVVDEPVPGLAGLDGIPGTMDDIPGEIGTEGNYGNWAGLYGQYSFDLVNGRDVNDDGNVNQADQLMARQLMARQLYVLAMMLMDSGYFQPTPGAGIGPTNVQWFTEFDDTNDPTGDIRRELAIRRLAQWAVNVVDYMDPDNIMTPFEYDQEPFTVNGGGPGTWNVDGEIHPTGGGDDASTWRRLAWGSEGQPLIITETIAFHDRRVADTDRDTEREDRGTPDSEGDDDLDQVRIPEGSLYVELYATHNSNNPAGSGDLYTFSNGEWYLDLARLAPYGYDGRPTMVPPGDPQYPNPRYPVWRLAISEPHPEGQSPRHFVYDPDGDGTIDVGTITTQFDSPSFNPNQVVTQLANDPPSNFSLLRTPPAAKTLSVPIDRIVWLAPLDPAKNFDNGTPNATEDIPRDDDRIYYGRQYFNPHEASSALVPGGSYAVVGPRQVTHIGSKLPPASPQATDQLWGDPSNHAIRFDAQGMIVTSLLPAPNDRDYPQEVRPVVCIVAAANPPPMAQWPNQATTAEYGIGISISEPLPQNQYYTEPTTNNAASGKRDAYDNLTQGGTPNYTFHDNGFDTDSTKTQRPLSPLYAGPLGVGNRTQTTFNYRTIFLQRLANPMMPYHPRTNPYLTIDWMPVDLTVFNGEDHISRHAGWSGATVQWDPADNNPEADDDRVALYSRQRGIYSSAAGGNYSNYDLYSLWPNWSGSTYNRVNFAAGEQPGEAPTYTTTPDSRAGDATSGVNFRHVLYHRGGRATDYPADAPETPPRTNRGTLGYLNHSYGPPRNSTENINGGPEQLGSPQQPFSWLAWNNRPFNNTAELLLVPGSAPGRLSIEAVADPNPNPYLDNDTIPPPTDSSTPPNNPANHKGPFSELVNFLNSSRPATGDNSNVDRSPNLSVLLDYVEVPSPFIGTNVVLDPSRFTWPGGAPGAEPPGTEGLHPPFCAVSNFRSPGRVNINTLPGVLSFEWDQLNGLFQYQGDEYRAGAATGTSESAVWNAILGADPRGTSPTPIPDPPFSRPHPSIPLSPSIEEQLIAESRRGYAAPTSQPNTGAQNTSQFGHNPYSMHPDPAWPAYHGGSPTQPPVLDQLYPSLMANPFRSAAGADMVPLVGEEPLPTTTATLADLRKRPIDATLYRDTSVLTYAGVTPPELPASAPAAPARPLFNGQNNPNFLGPYPVTQPDRNAPFAYQGISRLTEKLTTRSNVFAVWITVGYFEVEPAPAGYDRNVYPDGYQLGQELGSDTGDIQRHRGFYIIDRSIPVGFERGQNHNVEKTLLLKRFIE